MGRNQNQRRELVAETDEVDRELEGLTSASAQRMPTGHRTRRFFLSKVGVIVGPGLEDEMRWDFPEPTRWMPEQQLLADVVMFGVHDALIETETGIVPNWRRNLAGRKPYDGERWKARQAWVQRELRIQSAVNWIRTPGVFCAAGRVMYGFSFEFCLQAICQKWEGVAARIRKMLVEYEREIRRSKRFRS